MPEPKKPWYKSKHTWLAIVAGIASAGTLAGFVPGPPGLVILGAVAVAKLALPVIERAWWEPAK